MEAYNQSHTVGDMAKHSRIHRFDIEYDEETLIPVLCWTHLERLIVLLEKESY